MLSLRCLLCLPCCSAGLLWQQGGSQNLEALQHLLRLGDLDLLGHPTDEGVHMLARLTTLTAQIESNSPEDVSCQLPSVIKL